MSVPIPKNDTYSDCLCHEAAIIDIFILQMKTVQEKQSTRVRIYTQLMLVLCPCSVSSEVSFSLFSRHIGNDLIYEWFQRIPFEWIV